MCLEKVWNLKMRELEPIAWTTEDKIIVLFFVWSSKKN